MFICVADSITMAMDKLQEEERAIIIKLSGPTPLNQYLLIHGITVGTVFRMNYSPNYSGLISITVGGKMISLRRHDYQTIDWTRI